MVTERKKVVMELLVNHARHARDHQKDPVPGSKNTQRRAR